MIRRLRCSGMPAPKDSRNMSDQRLSAVTAARASRGFTLIEIMVVVVILGILAALVVPNVISNIDKAEVTKAHQDIKALETALSLYRMDNHKYPTTDQGLQSLTQQPNDP